MEEEITKVKQRFSIIGNAPALNEAIERAVKVAPTDLSVLVTGPSGVGKESFPKIIHQYGARKHRKYIAVNCGAIPEGTIDSELFGHEKGSFTGAVAARKGYFEEADGGTIFLDEVAELPLTTQARLLRVLESGEFLKVGSSVVQKTDVRIVAATNVDLRKAVEKGKFREDLYYRLSTIGIEVPPLSERGDDLFLLARKFASDFSGKYMTAPISFSEDARRLLRLYSWPGNIRQLKNVVEQLALFEAGSEISRHTLMEALPSVASEAAPPVRQQGASYESERQLLWQMLLSLRQEVEILRRRLGGYGELPAPSSATSAGGAAEGRMTRALAPWIPEPGPIFGSPSATVEETPPPPTSLEDAEREAVAAALARNRGQKSKAAAELGISLRTLYRKINEYGLNE